MIPLKSDQKKLIFDYCFGLTSPQQTTEAETLISTNEQASVIHTKIKASLEFSVADTALEDALAEFDELTVEGLLTQILDKAIACDDITAKVDDGPNTLEEFDAIGA